MYSLATMHEFGIGVLIDVLNVNEAWPASAWWRRRRDDDANQIVPSGWALLSIVPPWSALCHCAVAEGVTMAYLWTSLDVIWTNHVQVFCV